jgi:hypothetical protein
MRLAVFGATGQLGRQCVLQALDVTRIIADAMPELGVGRFVWCRVGSTFVPGDPNFVGVENFIQNVSFGEFGFGWEPWHESRAPASMCSDCGTRPHCM